MFGTFLTLLVVLLLIASFMRGNFALTLIYFVVGGLAAGLWWSSRALAQVEIKRRFNAHAFLGERIKVDLHVQNKGWLPVLWLELYETLPVALVGPNSFQSVINLGPRADANFEYSIEARKRVLTLRKVLCVIPCLCSRIQHESLASVDILPAIRYEGLIGKLLPPQASCW